MILEATVAPDSKRFSISSKGGRLKISLTSPAERNRANIELVSELTKLLGRRVRIISGQTSKRKRLHVDMTEAEWAEARGRLGF